MSKELVVGTLQEIDIKSILEMSDKHGLEPVKVSDFELRNRITLAIEEAEDFIKFTASMGGNRLYYSVYRYAISEYLIPSDWYDEYPKDFIREIHAHNKKINRLNFERPKQITLFVLQNGVMLEYNIVDNWIDHLGHKPADEQIEDFEDAYRSEIQVIKDNEKQILKDLANELREIIFNDSDFAHKKNQQLRYWYLVDLLDIDDNDRFRVMVEPCGIPHSGGIKIFMDETWRLYKEWKKEHI